MPLRLVEDSSSSSSSVFSSSAGPSFASVDGESVYSSPVLHCEEGLAAFQEEGGEDNNPHLSIPPPVPLVSHDEETVRRSDGIVEDKRRERERERRKSVGGIYIVTASRREYGSESWGGSCS